MIEVVASLIATTLLTAAGYCGLAKLRARALRAVCYETIRRMESILKPAGIGEYAVDLADLNSLANFFEEESSRIEYGFMRPNLKARLQLNGLREQVIAWKRTYTESGGTPTYILSLREGMQTRRGQKTASDRVAESLKAFADNLSVWVFFWD